MADTSSHRSLRARDGPLPLFLRTISCLAKKTPIWLGTFNSAEAAARAYDAATRSLRGSAACTNFPSAASSSAAWVPPAAMATSSHNSTVESWSSGAPIAGVLRATATAHGGFPVAEEDCRSYCDSSSSVLCEDGASGVGCNEAAAPRCSPLSFDLNLPAPTPERTAADEMDWRCDTLLRL